MKKVAVTWVDKNEFFSDEKELIMFQTQGLPDTFISTGRKLLMNGQDRFIDSIFSLP